MIQQGDNNLAIAKMQKNKQGLKLFYTFLKQSILLNPFVHAFSKAATTQPIRALV
jgi:hypothetical protein